MSKRVLNPTNGLKSNNARQVRFLQTPARGLDVLNSPWLNKGTAFSLEERRALKLVGLLPPEVNSIEQQVKAAYLQYERLPDAISKNIYLTALHDRNEVLFYRLFSENLREMIPIVNDLTVGLALVQYHHESRRPRGVYLSIDHADKIEESLCNFGVDGDGVDLVLATDAEHILGIGDWGVGGIEVSIGKLAICTAAGGVDPRRCIPVMLDVGTNRQTLLDDPMYVGNRHPRIEGQRYLDFIDEYVRIAARLFPHTLFQWEDLSPEHGRSILDRYKNEIPTFNDDMQGTGAIALAAAISASRICGSALHRHRIVIFGSGTAGIGVADQLQGAMLREGLSKKEALSRFWCIDKDGLMQANRSERLEKFQLPYARPVSEEKSWHLRSNDSFESQSGTRSPSLAEVIHQIQPTLLIGASDKKDAFSEMNIREMAANCERPIIFVLSNPAAKAEANAVDLVAWTDGRGLIATGAPRGPVTFRGVTHVIAQLSNSMLYPGLVLGAIVSRSSKLSDGMFAAAANAVSSLITVNQAGASLLPHIDDLRSVSETVACAVAEAAIGEGLSSGKLSDVGKSVRAAMWQPEYREIRAS